MKQYVLFLHGLEVGESDSLIEIVDTMDACIKEGPPVSYDEFTLQDGERNMYICLLGERQVCESDSLIDIVRAMDGCIGEGRAVTYDEFSIEILGGV